MKRMDFVRKMTAVALLFFLAFFFNSGLVEASGERTAKADASAWSQPRSDHAAANFVEKSGSERQVRKKRFPWLPVALVLAAGAAAVYFLVLNKDDAKEEGFRDDFSGSASPLWRPRSAAMWSVVADAYRCFNSQISFSETNYLDRMFNSDNLSIEARLRQTFGDIKHGQGVFFVTGTTMTAVSGFEFRIHTYQRSPGAFSIIRYENTNLNNNTGGTSVVAITNNAAISGAPAWNTVRIVRSGSAYSFYCNGVLLHTFTDASFDPAVAGIHLWSTADPHNLECDFFSVAI